MGFKERFAKLVDLKSIITFTVMGALTYGFIARFVSVEVYVPFATAIVTYYFQRKKSEGEG